LVDEDQPWSKVFGQELWNMAGALHCKWFDSFDGGRSQAIISGQGPGNIAKTLSGSNIAGALNSCYGC